MANMHWRGRTFTKKTIAGAITALVLSATVHAQVRNVDIPAGDLKAALDAYVAQTGQQLVYRSDDLRGLRSKGVQGGVTPEQALERLLDGTALKVRRDSSGAVVLFLGEAAAAGAAAATGGSVEKDVAILPTVYVTGTGVSHLAELNRTGTRTDVDPMALPQSVSTVSKELLEQQQVRDLRDAVANVAGVSGTGQDDGLITMRGFPAGVMRNGNIVTAVSGVSAINAPLITISKVEVVKGPEAIVAGVASTYGGVVNVITKSPQATPVREVVASIGSRGYYEVGADFGGALTEDKRFLARVVGSTSNSGRDEAGYKGAFRDYISPSFTWANRSSGTDLTLSYEDQRSRVKPFSRVYFAPGQPFDKNVKPAFIPPGDSGRSENQQVLSLAFSQRLGMGWELGVKLSRDRKEATIIDTAAGARPRLDYPYPNLVASVFVNDSVEVTKTAKLELKGNFETGPVEHSLLLAYDDLRSNFVSGFARPALTVTNIDTGITTDITAALGENFGIPAPREETTVKPKEKGFLVYDHLSWGPWVALAGWRQVRYAPGDPNLPDPASFSRGLPSLGVLYRWNSTLSLYGSASKGFQPNIGLFTVDGASIAPETAKQFEAGFKAQLANRKLALTGAIYEIKQRNVAVPDFENFSPTGLFWFTVPGATARGAELELSGNPTPRLSLRSSYAYLNKRADSPDAVGIVFVRHQGSVWASYHFGDISGKESLGWWLGGGLQMRSASLGLEAPAIASPGDHRFDLNGGYQAKRWSFVAGVKNLANSRLYTTSSRGERVGTLVQPREFYATARYNF